jgi:hypothetical protein
MTLQKNVLFDYGFGVVGESRKHGARRAKPGFIVTTDPTQNVVGRAFTQPGAGGAVSAGGTGIFYGILAWPKQYASRGTAAGGPLAPTLTLPNNVEAEFVEADYALVVMMSNASVQIGDYVVFANATGVLTSVRPGAALPANSTQILGAVVNDLPQPTAGGLCTISLTGPLPVGPAAA